MQFTSWLLLFVRSLKLQMHKKNYIYCYSYVIICNYPVCSVLEILQESWEESWFWEEIIY